MFIHGVLYASKGFGGVAALGVGGGEGSGGRREVGNRDLCKLQPFLTCFFFFGGAAEEEAEASEVLEGVKEDEGREIDSGRFK